ncbi:MAG: hypothetical protein LBS84_11415 [Clostridiales bacterium]|jgi:hypothetical protein|nr:hypothetical protein [Clostridiales bacterium]
MRRFLCILLAVCCLYPRPVYGAETEIPDAVPVEIEGSKGFSDICQQMLGYVTGLDCRNAHFYILMDVSGSTKANGVSDSFARFYDFLNTSFFYAGDKFSYIPFALDVDWSMRKDYDYDPERNPIISAGNLTDDMGTDWYKPIFLLLRQIEEENLKTEMPVVILHLSDRADNDDPRPDAYLRNDFYPKADPGGWREWERLQHVFNVNDRTLRFTATANESGEHAESFHLAVWYADNIGDFEINRKLNRERGIEGEEVMLAAQQDTQEVTFRMRQKPGTAGYNLYIADSRDALTVALNDSAASDKEHAILYENIKYEDNPIVPDIKEYKILNTDLLQIFPDAEKNSLFYSVREIDANYGESQMRFVRELPPLIVEINITSILMVFGLLALLAAVLLSFQRINCVLVLNGDQKFLLSGGKAVYLKCMRAPAPRNVQAFKTYPSPFDNKNIAKLDLSPKMFIPLFKLNVHVSRIKEGADLTGPPVLREGRNKFTASVDESRLEFTVDKKDLIKKNFGKLITFSIFLLAGAVLMIASLAL